MNNYVDTLTMITKGPTRAVQHDERSTGELQCCKLASTYRGDKVGDVHDGPDGGDSDDDVVDVGQEMVVMKRSDQLLLLFSGGGRVGGEAARGLESRDTPDGEIIENFVRSLVEMN